MADGVDDQSGWHYGCERMRPKPARPIIRPSASAFLLNGVPSSTESRPMQIGVMAKSAPIRSNDSTASPRQRGRFRPHCRAC